MTFFHRKKYLDEFKMRFQKILIKDCRRLPIRPVHQNNAEQKRSSDELIRLVRLMLRLNHDLHRSKVEQHKTALHWQIKATDSEIDILVYQLYGFTEVEIATARASLSSERELTLASDPTP
jgi:hypothetical protein